MISSLLGPREHRLPSPRGPGAADVAGEMGPRSPRPLGLSMVGSAQPSAPRPEAHCLCAPASAPQRPPLGRGEPPGEAYVGEGAAGLSLLVTASPSPSSRSTSFHPVIPGFFPLSPGAPSVSALLGPSWRVAPKVLPHPLSEPVRYWDVVTPMPREN